MSSQIYTCSLNLKILRGGQSWNFQLLTKFYVTSFCSNLINNYELLPSSNEKIQISIYLSASLK